MQGTQRPPVSQGGVRGVRFSQRAVELGHHHGIQARVHLFDSADVLLDHLSRRELTGCDAF